MVDCKHFFKAPFLRSEIYFFTLQISSVCTPHFSTLFLPSDSDLYWPHQKVPSPLASSWVWQMQSMSRRWGEGRGKEGREEEGGLSICLSNIPCKENNTVNGPLSNHPWRKLPNHWMFFKKQIAPAMCAWWNLELVGGKCVDQESQSGLNLGKIIEEIYGGAEMVINWEAARKKAEAEGL